jgi:hypothetical protein
VDTPRPSPRTNRTRRVPHPVLIGHAASLSQERISTSRREAATAQLFAEGLGALDSVSGQREGAGAEGARDAGALARRGLEAGRCSITQVPLPHSARTKWTHRVPHPVLSGHTASLTPY